MRYHLHTHDFFDFNRRSLLFCLFLSSCLFYCRAFFSFHLSSFPLSSTKRDDTVPARRPLFFFLHFLSFSFISLGHLHLIFISEFLCLSLSFHIFSSHPPYDAARPPKHCTISILFLYSSLSLSLSSLEKDASPFLFVSSLLLLTFLAPFTYSVNASFTTKPISTLISSSPDPTYLSSYHASSTTPCSNLSFYPVSSLPLPKRKNEPTPPFLLLLLSFLLTSCYPPFLLFS